MLYLRLKRVGKSIEGTITTSVLTIAEKQKRPLKHRTKKGYEILWNDDSAEPKRLIDGLIEEDVFK